MARQRVTGVSQVSQEKKDLAKAAVLGSGSIPSTRVHPESAVRSKPPVVSDVELSLPSEKNTATYRPDLLGHPFHAELEERGLEGFYSAKDMLDFNATRGFRIFKRPAGSRDEHVIFHGTDGDTVQRGDLILMVRPKAFGKQEILANARAYEEDVATLQDEMKEKMPALGTRAEGQVSLQAPEFSTVGPTDGAREEEMA